MGLFSIFKKKNNEVEELGSLPIDEVDEDSLKDYELFKIDDPQTLTKIAESIPTLAKQANKVILKKNKPTLYTCDIDLSDLVKSSDGKSYRAIKMGKDGIEKNAKLQVFKDKKLINSVGASAFQVASIVVGQHYMTEISESMKDISSNINDIVEFQNIEFQSQVKTLLRDIASITNNQSEIISSDELRKQEIMNLNRYEHDAEKLLEQATDMINNFTKKKIDEAKDYFKKVNELSLWLSLQKSLFQIIEKIADLKYVLNLGAASLDYCKNKINDYFTLVNDSLKRLSSWHAQEIALLNVDTSNLEYKRNKWYNKLMSKAAETIKVSDKAINYVKIDEGLVKKIVEQTRYDVIEIESSRDSFYEPFKIVMKDGEYYYARKVNE